MRSKLFLTLMLIRNFLPIGKLSAQKIIFDPSLDSLCKVQSQPAVERWNTNYMWYPGQLSALLQDQLQYKSKERATNVGYPDYFYQKEPIVFFHRQVKLSVPATIKWSGPDIIICYLNGKLIEKTS